MTLWSPDRRRTAAIVVALLLPFPAAAAADTAERFQVEGLFDGQAYKTDADSVVMSRNEGRPGATGGLWLFEGLEITPGLHLLASHVGELGPEGESFARMESCHLRWVTPYGLEVDAGKLNPPIGAFAARRFANRNPLIGAPDAYAVTYPTGVQVSAVLSKFDVRVAAMDLPLVNTNYLPSPDRRYRPAAGAGYSPTPGLRFGVYYTEGSYLNEDLTASMPAGERWSDFDQTLLGLEMRLRHGYTEVNTEVTFSGYDVPTHDTVIHGLDAYVEVRRTLTPRLFAATRVEKNDYAYVMPINPFFWVGTDVNFYSAEAGLGYRVGVDTIVKASYRKDYWTVPEDLKAILPDGYAFSLQISQSFDPLAPLRRVR